MDIDKVVRVVWGLDPTLDFDLEKWPWPYYGSDTLDPEKYDLYEANYDWLYGGKETELDFDKELRDEIVRRLEEIEKVKSPKDGYWISKETMADVCAWYQPIYIFGFNFGIYIKEECLLQQAYQISQFIHNRPLVLHQYAISLIRASFAALYLHEQYHHKTESFAIRLHAASGINHYLNYFNNVYLRALTHSTSKSEPLEEALANADAFNRLNDEPYKALLTQAVPWLPLVQDATKNYLLARYRNDPPGYCDAPRYLGTAFNGGESQLQLRIHEGTITPSNSPELWEVANHMIRGLFNLRERIYTVVPKGKSSIFPTSFVQPVTTCSSNELIKLANSKGFSIKRGGGKGSHVKMVKPGSRPVIIPANEKNVSPGVVKNTLLAVLGTTSLEALPAALAEI